MLTVLCAVAMLESSEPFRTWGLETVAQIREAYKLPNGLYSDAVEDGKKSHEAFNWGVGVWITALNGAAKADPAWKPELASFIEKSRVYWNDKGPVPGYDVLPGPKPVDRYYDDNEWMVMGLSEAYDILADKRLLDWAESTLKYALSGEDSKLGGGIYWRESDKASKNTCSNGPGAAACLAIYERTQKKEYLEKAVQIYHWTKKTLQDPQDHLFWDSIDLSGKVDRTKWSYNTALMIRTAAQLGRFTKNERYLKEAEEIAAASEKRWVNVETGAINDGGRFAHLLLESWNYVPTPERQAKARRAVTWVREHGRDTQLRYGGEFNRPPKADQKKFELIDQAAAARAFFVSP